MPAATNWLDLYKFEDAIESAALAIIAGAGIQNAYIQRAAEEIATPSVGVQLSVGGATEHYGRREGDGEIFLDTWTGTLTFAIMTDRTRNRAFHTDNLAKLRWLMQNVQAFEPLMPFHQITKIIETGTSPQLKAEDDRDVSEISFAIIFNIRAGSWPAANE